MAEIDEITESKAQIKREIDELKSSNITLENYKKFSDKIRNKDTIIESQVENFKNDYVRSATKLKELMKRDSFKETLDNNYVDREIFDLQKDMLESFSGAYGWKVVQTEMYNIIFSKLIELVDETNAYGIKRDALKEMREMEEKRNEVIIESVSQMIDFTKNVVRDKFSIMDEKMNTSFEMYRDQSRVERNEIFEAFTKLVDSLVDKTDANIEIVKKIRPLEENQKMKGVLNSDSSRGLYSENNQEERKEVVSKKKGRPRKEEVNNDIEASFDDYERQQGGF